MSTAQKYRIVTASSLFDGHDASINVFRRLLQRAGAELIHLGHDRSVRQIVKTALEEDADAVCVSSYQGGHMEYFRYMYDLLQESDAGGIEIFGGGGGTILHDEIDELHQHGITRLYHADDGHSVGLDGIINDLISRISKSSPSSDEYEKMLLHLSEGKNLSWRALSQLLTLMENSSLSPQTHTKIQDFLQSARKKQPLILGVTGPGGAGKSSLLDELIQRFLYASPNGKLGILAFDPTKRTTGGALLGDRIRMNSVYNERVFMRSMATRGSSEVGETVAKNLALMRHSDFDLIILETSGIGQGDAAVRELCDLSLYVMTSEYGASTQLEKIDMIDLADFIVVNKFDKLGALDALEDVIHAYAFSRQIKLNDKNRKKLPIFGTTASNFNDPGVSQLFTHLMKTIQEKQALSCTINLEKLEALKDPHNFSIVPPQRSQYLSEITKSVRCYSEESKVKAKTATELYQVQSLSKAYSKEFSEEQSAFFEEKARALHQDLGVKNRELIERYTELEQSYRQEMFTYEIRGKEISRPLFQNSLSDSKIPRIALPRYHDWGDILRFMRQEGFPGYFPYTAGGFPLRNDDEEPKRQFAGEGSPARTNKRFHYLSEHDPAKRLSTAFDSVTLYGEDPSKEPDVYGKVGNSGVSIATLDHMKTLFKGFDLADRSTSVSLTINGPAPMILAMFLNAAIDFEIEKQTGKPREKIDSQDYNRIRDQVLQVIRGTVQADILKEEQAQNTCIFSSKFAVKMMGDVQEYFIKKSVRNFYSVSISGYHIAEAGANPITQLALTLSNAFTYVEYYLSRGMDIDEFAPNLSFFFSMGLDPEYAVIGRVARRIWSIAIRDHYKGNARSQKLKYHIQTSGRSLHAQEIAFNDIRTTLQALMSIYDNCNSLHTNAYDEAITTPTEESVRRAMAIQLIINREYGLSKCQNSNQGSFIIEELTDLVEEAVLDLFDAISRRGGVLGAMEKQFQRHRIQTESMKYEQMKASGDLPLIGVNTFIGHENTNEHKEMEVIRATTEEKEEQIRSTQEFIQNAGDKNKEALEKLRQVALSGENIFEELMETVKYASLGQISHLLYQCGGEYRRSM